MALAALRTSTRRSRLQFFQGLFLSIATSFGYACGSPIQRCILGVLLMFSSQCMTHCRQWQRSLCLYVVFLVGPYSELASTYAAYESLGASSPQYSVIWFDNFVFSLVMEIAKAFISSTLDMPAPAFLLLNLCYVPAGLCWALVLPPTWLASVPIAPVLLALSQISSVGIFAGLDLTSKEFRDKERAHERYIAALSHDFGTPISALQMATTQLRERLLPSKEDEEEQGGSSQLGAKDALPPLFDGMSAALEVMTLLKRKAIDVGKLHLGESLHPERAPFRIRDLIAKVQTIARYMPHNEHVRDEYFVSPDLAELVNTDGSWLFMIVLNLVSNAYKATAMGSVSVSARLAAGHIRLTVADTGVGVSSAVESQLWTAFKQSSRWASGTGLGLYHVDALARALGGSVGYQPNIQAGNGACFWVDVPYVPCDDGDNGGRLSAHAGTLYADKLNADVAADRGSVADSPAREAVAPSPMASLTGAGVVGTVLLAEDSIFIQELTAGLLRQVGASDVRCACNGEEALQKLTASDAPEYTLVLMDVQMPFLDGIECTRRVRAWEAQTGRKRLRILALSANGEDAACIRDCIAAGMDGVLTKPLAVRTICKLLGVNPPTAPSPSSNKPPGGTATVSTTAALPSPPTAPSYDGADSTPTAPSSSTSQRDAASCAACSGWDVASRATRPSAVAGYTEAGGAGGGAVPLTQESPPPVSVAPGALDGDGATSLAVVDFSAVVALHNGPDAARRSVSNFLGLGAAQLKALAAAVRRDDSHEAVAREAHKLKGMCLYAGAPAMRAAVVRVELAARATPKDAMLDVAADMASLQAEFERVAAAYSRFLAHGATAGEEGGAGSGDRAFSPDAANRC